MAKLMTRLKSFILECKRVLKITRKPSKVEFKTIVKASALGMAVVGMIGFVISILRQVIFQG